MRQTENTGADIARLTTSIEAMNSNLKDVVTEMRVGFKQQYDTNQDIYGRLNSGMKTDWNLVIAVVGAVGALVVIMFTVYLRPIETSVEYLSGKLNTQNERINTLESKRERDFEQIIRLDERLKTKGKSGRR